MQTPQVDIIILRGAPGSGKSQTAKSLAHFFPKGVRIEVDTLRQMVISVDWKNQEEHKNMLEVSARLVSDFLRLEFKPVIVVDTFSGNKLERYLEILHQFDKKMNIKIIGLFTTDNELRKRLEQRSEAEFRDYQISKKLNDEVKNSVYNSEFQIDTTGHLPIKTAELVYHQFTKRHLSRSNPLYPPAMPPNRATTEWR